LHFFYLFLLLRVNTPICQNYTEFRHVLYPNCRSLDSHDIPYRILPYIEWVYAVEMATTRRGIVLGEIYSSNLIRLSGATLAPIAASME
jgi:hypothetical protein